MQQGFQLKSRNRIANDVDPDETFALVKCIWSCIKTEFSNWKFWWVLIYPSYLGSEK